MTTKLLLLLGISAISIMGRPVEAGSANAASVLPQLPKPRHRFVVIAHRGLHNRAPENSLAAFDAGARAGVDFVEMDLRTTKDSVLVLLHDATLDRTTNGKGPVAGWNYPDLKKLKLNAVTGFVQQVPRFDSTLAVCRSRVYIYLDFKSASVSQTMKLVRRYQMQDQLIVYINTPEQYREWKETEPEIPLMLSVPDTVKTAAGISDFLKRYPSALLDGDYDGYNREMVEEAKNENVPAWPDIQGAQESLHWAKAIDTGFRGLQTDHPEALIAWLEERGLR